jgi:hypothetical protein
MSENFLDGIVLVVDDNWRVFGQACRLNLTRQFGLEEIGAGSLEGLYFERSEKTSFRIVIGDSGQFSVAVVCTVDAIVDQPEIVAEIEDAKVLIVMGMPESLSFDNWTVLHANRRTTHVTDVSTFGAKFVTRIKEIISLHCGGIYYFETVLYSFGEDLKFDNIANFNVELSKRIVIHYARNWERSNHVLLWEMKKFEQNTRLGAPTRWYPVALMKTVSNLYWDKLKRECTADLPFKACQLKCYSQLFSNAHHGNSVRMEHLQIAEALWSPLECAFGFSEEKQHYPWNKFKGQVTRSRALIEQVGTSKTSYKARAEMVIVLGKEKSLAAIQDIPRIVEAHGTFSSRVLEQCFIEIPTHLVAGHVRRNTLPFIDTLEIFIQRRRDQLSRNTMEFTPGNF